MLTFEKMMICDNLNKKTKEREREKMEVMNGITTTTNNNNTTAVSSPFTYSTSASSSSSSSSSSVVGMNVMLEEDKAEVSVESIVRWTVALCWNKRESPKEWTTRLSALLSSFYPNSFSNSPSFGCSLSITLCGK